MKTIQLHGILAKKFGKSFRLSVGSTKEAMRALCVQLTGFEAFMMNAHKQGLRFAVFHDKHNVGESELDMNHTAKIIRVVPVVEGSKKEGVLETVIGAVLVVAGVVDRIVHKFSAFVVKAITPDEIRAAGEQFKSHPENNAPATADKLIANKSGFVLSERSLKNLQMIIAPLPKQWHRQAVSWA
ncbi:tail assembly protein [Moraxella catarrhalis]|uniref:hypothetical protein n=1 Tax=Moraxella catarrhalis TaxID=480 RepID=UPI001D0DBDE9|nr:hypothetical protein [Moraxella catarrhalis]